MSLLGEGPPETILAQRSVETGQSLRDGELVSRVESDGDSRVVRVTDAAGAIRYTLARFSPSDTRGRLLPDWVPFVPDVELMLTEREGRRLMVFNVSPGIPGRMRAAATRLTEALEGLGLEEEGSLERPDGSVGHDALATYAHAVQEELPPGVRAELKALWSGGGTDTERLDRAWRALRSWYRDRGWEAEDVGMNGPQVGVRTCRFSKGSERHDATASSIMGIQHILVCAQERGGGS